MASAMPWKAMLIEAETTSIAGSGALRARGLYVGMPIPSGLARMGNGIRLRIASHALSLPPFCLGARRRRRHYTERAAVPVSVLFCRLRRRSEEIATSTPPPDPEEGG